MKREINPSDTSRKQAFDMWIDSTMPMVTLFKDIDVTHLVRVHRRTGLKINMLICYCIVKVAGRIREFYMLPMEGRLMEFDQLGVSIVVRNSNGGINWADLTLIESLQTFNDDYLRLTSRVAETCESLFNQEQMNIGVSNLSRFEIDGVVNQYNGWYNNPFLCWGKFRRKWFRSYMRLSFQFHHVQMDGEQACTFLEYLQEEVNRL